MQLMEARPPYVQFERRAVAVRTPAMLPDGVTPNPDAGQLSYRDVDFAIIMQIGGKDKVEKEVADWFANNRVNVQADRMPRAWQLHYETLYEAFKNQQEAPVNGTPIRNWPMASPAEVENLLRLNVRAVEDLAQANEQTIAGLGMGGRALKQKAQDWLSSKSDTGPLVEQLNSLRLGLESAQKMLQEQKAQLAAQDAELRVLRSFGRGQGPAPAGFTPLDPASQLATLQAQSKDPAEDDFDLAT